MQQFNSDMAVVQERMGDQSGATTIKSILEGSRKWFQMGLAYLKPPAAGLRELPIPQVIVAEGRTVSAALEGMVESASAYGFAFRTDADTAVESMKTNLAILAAATVLAGILLAFGSAYSMVRPLRKLTAGMKELGEGNFDVVLPGVGRKDEIGAIAGAVEILQGQGQAESGRGRAAPARRDDGEGAARRRRAAAESGRAPRPRRRRRPRSSRSWRAA